jgi:alcohol dehydrogenase class IV
VNAALATEAMRLLARGLPAVRADPFGAGGREQAPGGAHLAATAFTSAGSGLHHKIGHVLGGTFNLPHAQTHAVMLPRTAPCAADEPPQHRRCDLERLLRSAWKETPMISLVHHLAQLFHLNRKQDLVLCAEEVTPPPSS